MILRALTALMFCLGCGGTFAATGLAEQLDQLEREGRDRPEETLAAFDRLSVSDAVERRQWTYSRGMVLATNGRSPAAREVADSLRRLDPDVHGEAGLIAADLVLSELALREGRIDRAAPLANAALERLRVACQTEPSTCDWRRLSQAQLQVSTAASRRGLLDESLRHAEGSLASAKQLNDAFRLVVAELRLASVHMNRHAVEEARKHLLLAQGLAAPLANPTLNAKIAITASGFQLTLGDLGKARQTLNAAVRDAQAAGLPNLSAMLLGNLSDMELQSDRPAEALRAAQAALPIARRYKDQRNEALLLHNMGIARMASGQFQDGKRDIESSIALLEQAGATAELTESLREYTDALAKSGDVKGALAAYHRERQLMMEAMRDDRDNALAELNGRHNRDAQRKEIELRTQRNALHQAQLDNQAAAQRLWALAAVVAILAASLLWLLIQRMRQTQRTLRQRQDDLRVQSELDSLTGLANRRSFTRHLEQSCNVQGQYHGALLMIDLDHFKRVNDSLGHAAGDEVLKEVANRLRSIVREGDVVARWGGEEFVIHAASTGPAGTDQLAQRLLMGIGGTPITLPSGPLRVTASIGFAHLPLPPHQIDLGWEQALNLVDMALYLAKSQGRNQAQGITEVSAVSAEALAHIEADFEQAVQSGHATLRQWPGPLA